MEVVAVVEEEGVGGVADTGDVGVGVGEAIVGDGVADEVVVEEGAVHIGGV